MSAANEFAFAFQPIVEIDSSTIWAYEALVRGPDGGSAWSVLDAHQGADRYDFDRRLQVGAIETAAHHEYSGRLALNMLSGLPSEVTETIEVTLAAAERVGFPVENLIFEVSERDAITELDAFAEAVLPGRRAGSSFALDDFGAGYSGLNLLAHFQPDYIKLDLLLVRNISKNGPRQAIIRGVMRTCLDLGIEVVAEGVEHPTEFDWLYSNGVRLYQGYLFAKPGFDTFCDAEFPPFDR